MKVLELPDQLVNLLDLSIQQLQHVDAWGLLRIVKTQRLPYVCERKAQILGLAYETEPLYILLVIEAVPRIGTFRLG